jgi:peptide/nickel transport system substrate-binding protein
MEQPNYWKRLARRRISRRALLSATATTAIGGAAALVVGCNGSNGGNGVTRPSRSIGPVGSPRPGGSITWGRAVSVLGIDPHVDILGLDLDPLFYSYLYNWIPSSETMVMNDFATQFEHPDDVTFIFSLRPGVKIQANAPGGGEEMTSEDCKQSFIRRGTSITAPDKRFPFMIAGAASHEALSAALQTPDPRTFSFVMKEPFVPALREMANPTWAIVPAKVIDKFPSLSQIAHGSGPFILEEFRGHERIVMKRNPDYFLSPRPWLDGITFVVITENSSLLSAFKNGQHDVNGALLTKDDFDDMSDDPDFVTFKTPQMFYPVIHLKIRPPFDQLKVRKAVDLAINRDEMLAVIDGGEGNFNGAIQWGQFKWSLPQEELRAFYKYDPEQAKALLKEAGYEHGFNAKMKLPKLPGAEVVGDLAVLIKDQLGRVGINIQLDEVELGAFIASTLLSGNFDMAFFPNLPYDEPDRPLSFYHTLGVTGSGNWNNYSNKELDKLIDAQAKEFDEAKRKEIIFKAQRLILEEHGPQITLTDGYSYGAHWSYVHSDAPLLPIALVAPQMPGQSDAQAGPFGVDIWTEKA